VLRVQGNTNTVVLIKDTQKEEREKAIQKSWEDKEPGRADKSKKVRRKYQALLKRQEGAALDEAEVEMLNEPRVSRKERLEKGKQVQQKAAKAVPAKKDNKKPNEEVEVKQTQVNFPKSHEHHMDEVHSFLKKLEGETTKHEYAQNQGLINIRSLEEHHQLLESLALSTEDFNSILLQCHFQRERMKTVQTALNDEQI